MAITKIPGPTNLTLLPKIGSIQSKPLDFLLWLYQTYGPVSRFQAFNTPVIHLADPEAVKHVLQENHRNYSKDTIQYNSLAIITGNGLLTNDGTGWLRQRRLAQPAFARGRLSHLDQIVIPSTQSLLTRWRQLPEGYLIDVDAEMMRLTLEIVGKALFSIDLSKDAPHLTEATLTTLDYIVYRVKTLTLIPTYLPLPRNRAFQKALKTLEEAVSQIIQQRRKDKVLGEDLLGMFLRARDEESGEGMSDRQIRDEVMTMLIAGHETVASALTWTWYLLSTHPEIENRLFEEVHTVLKGNPPSTKDLENLPYTAQVFTEALRLYPPAWLITRKAMGEDEILGYSIPPGAIIVISPYVIHRLKEHWENPEAFIPERFARDPEGTSHRFTFIPFGAGPRLCIGNQFAHIEARLILAGMTQELRFTPPPKAPVVDALVTLRPRNGLHMSVVHQSSNSLK